MQLRYDVPLTTTFRVSARARWYAEIREEAEIQEAIAFAKQRQIPWLVIGEGSNVLLTQNFPGIVLHLQMARITVESGSASVILTVEAGCHWHTVVAFAARRHLWGIENLAFIPGSAGAAPVQNIGAYGVELKDVVHRLRAYDTQTERFVVLDPAACQFGYRTSIFKEHPDRWIITAIALQLSPTPRPQLTYPDLAPLRAATHLTPGAIMETIGQIRRRKLPDPAQLPNAGSFFKNPIVDRTFWEQLRRRFPQLPGFPIAQNRVKIPAAWLIEFCGWKGKRRNGAGVSPHHALVLVNYGTSSGKAIAELAEHIQQSVFHTFGILLEPEVRIL